jgi:hypothetical protein
MEGHLGEGSGRGTANGNNFIASCYESSGQVQILRRKILVNEENAQGEAIEPSIFLRG